MIFNQNHSPETDEALMERLIKKDDREALSELYVRYNKRLLAFLYKMLGGNAIQAQDFLQDVFLKVYEKRHQFNPDKKFYAWLFAIAGNKCKNTFRANARQTEVSLESQPERGKWDVMKAEQKETRQQIRTAIHQLDYHHKVVFILRHIEGFSLADIAAITETSVGTVKSRLFYGTRKLAEELNELAPQGKRNE